jgi:hypothetical protein
MVFVSSDDMTLDYLPCQYGKSKLLFRGPQRPLTEPYCAILGGTETYGKFVADPFAALLEAVIGRHVINLGCPNAGPDVFLNDPAILHVAGGADVTVVQVLGAQNLTNSYYAVHPRRNDRFLRAAQPLRQLYPEVDFTEFHFNRHMLQALYAVDPLRFVPLADELRIAWVARTAEMIRRLPGPVVLLWTASHAPPAPGATADPSVSPVLVDSGMIQSLRGLVADYVEVVSSSKALAEGVSGMIFAPLYERAASELPGPAVHREIAAALADRLQPFL